MKHSKLSETSPEHTVELPAGNIFISITLIPNCAYTDTIQVCAVTFIGRPTDSKMHLLKLSRMISSMLPHFGFVSLMLPTVQ
jgi:hypothetical protein